MNADKESSQTVVLVIDGDNVRRGMLACSLPPSRYVVEFAKTSEAGLDLLGRVNPSIVVVGLDDSTTDLCQRIRTLPSGDRCLLLLMDETFNEETDVDMAGADVALPFPFTMEAFEDHVAQHRLRPQMIATRQLPAVTIERSKTPPSQPAVVDGWESFRGRVDFLFENLSTLDYYQLLQVARDASMGEIKDAYFGRSMEFHPDRFVQLEDLDLRQRNYEVYKRMTEAFRVLTRPDARAAYQEELEAPLGERSVRFRGGGQWQSSTALSSLASSGRWSEAKTPTGCRYLRFAELARQSGNLKSAKMYLSLAVQWEPNNGDLRRIFDDVCDELKT